MPSPGRRAPAGLARAALGTQVSDLLLDEVRSGRWPVGEKIPVEAELVAWSGVGRNTVREAVSSLVQAGILRREQGRGTFVRSTSELQNSVGRQAARSSRRDVLELRLALDTAASQIAALRRSDADVAGLRELLLARRETWATSDRSARVLADSALHRAIVSAAHNTLLEEVYDGLLSVFEEVLTDDVKGEEDHLATLHDDLVEAVAAGDPERATRTMSQLLQPMINEFDRD